MALLKFKGVLENLSESQKQFIRDVLEKQGYKNNMVLFEPAGKAGDNFIAQVLRITVKVEDGDDFTMIGKIAPHDEFQRDMLNVYLAFKNETIMYEEVLPRYSKLQIDAGVTESERLRYAKSYGCLSEEFHEVILLEDLKSLDYVMLDRLSSMNDDGVILVIKNFANLHAMSFALMHKTPDIYKKYSSRLAKVWDILAHKDENKAFMKGIEESALALLKDEYYKNVVRGISNKHTLIEKINQENNPKYLVIQQGDAWTNNIMFKLKDGKPVDAIMIDYQLTSVSSPAADLIYFIFNCTNHDTRINNYHKWINLYHQELDKYLSYFGLKASFVYPKAELDADLKRYANFLFGTVIMMYSVVSRNSKEAADLQEAFINYNTERVLDMQVDTLSEETIKKFILRLEELIDSYCDLGYFS